MLNYVKAKVTMYIENKAITRFVRYTVRDQGTTKEEMIALLNQWVRVETETTGDHYATRRAVETRIRININQRVRSFLVASYF